jgi:mannose-6-phosphate isomerase-like protein (cupin superfamily)
MIRRAAILALALAACHKNETVGVIEGPPFTIAPDAAPLPSVTPDAAVAEPLGATDAAPAPSDAPSPIVARFVDLSAKAPETVTFRACEQYFVAVARGKAKVAGEALAVNDVLVASGAGSFDVTGDGLALIASARPNTCEPVTEKAIHKTVVRGAKTAALTFAGGKMQAHLDVESAVSQLAYFGRLEGTAPVAEHAHDGSWEVLCAVTGAGTFTLNGAEQRLAAKQIVVVPPGTKHAWKPDDGVKLVAFQMYAPPGPEQRFKKLAAEMDAGAAKKP